MHDLRWSRNSPVCLRCFFFLPGDGCRERNNEEGQLVFAGSVFYHPPRHRNPPVNHPLVAVVQLHLHQQFVIINDCLTSLVLWAECDLFVTVVVSILVIPVCCGGKAANDGQLRLFHTQVFFHCTAWLRHIYRVWDSHLHVAKALSNTLFIINNNNIIPTYLTKVNVCGCTKAY